MYRQQQFIIHNNKLCGHSCGVASGCTNLRLDRALNGMLSIIGIFSHRKIGIAHTKLTLSFLSLLAVEWSQKQFTHKYWYAFAATSICVSSYEPLQGFHINLHLICVSTFVCAHKRSNGIKLYRVFQKFKRA